MEKTRDPNRKISRETKSDPLPGKDRLHPDGGEIDLRSAGNLAVQNQIRSAENRAAVTLPPGAHNLAPNAEALGMLAGVGMGTGSASQIADSGRSGSPSEALRFEAGESGISGVRIYDNFASRRAAAQLGAYAYSWQGDIFLGAGLGKAGAPGRAEAISHELLHAMQARNRGTRAGPGALEAEAYRASGGWPALAADPQQPLGLWWVIPVAVGLYILLRPSPANAPGPEDVPQPRVSELQITGEALTLFAVPGGVASSLGRMGFGIVSSFAISGAVSSMSYRGVQDIGAGQFSGVQAYVIDGTTGAIIGVVVGGVLRPFVGARWAAMSRPQQSLVHLTDQPGAAGIVREGVLRGSQGIYGLPQTAANEGTIARVFRTLLRPAQTARSVPIPQGAQGLFRQPAPIGPLSIYQRLMGVYRAPAGSINILTGGFTPSSNALANVTGQFFPYGMDALLWVGAGAAAMSPAAEGAYQRGLYSPLYQLLGAQTDQPVSTRTDGPFILTDPSMLATPESPIDSPLDFGAAGMMDPYDWLAPAATPPAVIVVQPLDQPILEGGNEPG